MAPNRKRGELTHEQEKDETMKCSNVRVSQKDRLWDENFQGKG